VIETPGKIVTRVLGTSFNLRGYEHEVLSELTVLTGRVAFGKLHDTNPTVFTVNQQVILNTETGELIVRDDLNSNALAWRTKKLVFDNTSLREVAETMGMFYQIKIVIPEDCNDYKFSGKFENPDATDFATILGSTFDFSFVVSDKAIVFDSVKKKLLTD
jgi:ferric-dicitrate binding protein FerR (iron transport regulator)